MDKPIIEVFGRKNCPWCDRAKELLDRLGFAYAYRDMSAQPELLKEFTERTKGAKTVPQIIVGRHLVGGFEQLRKASQNGQLQQLIGGM